MALREDELHAAVRTGALGRELEHRTVTQRARQRSRSRAVEHAFRIHHCPL